MLQVPVGPASQHHQLLFCPFSCGIFPPAVKRRQRAIRRFGIDQSTVQQRSATFNTEGDTCAHTFQPFHIKAAGQCVCSSTAVLLQIYTRSTQKTTVV